MGILKNDIMTISKKFIKEEIKSINIIIEGLNNESEKYPQIQHHNNKSVLRLEGKIQAYESLIKNF